MRTVLGKGTRPVVFHGLSLAQGELAELPAAVPRKLEFLGDSETSGFGNLGPSQPGDQGSLRSVIAMDPAHQDVQQSWPAIVAAALNAQYHVIAWSGIGALWNAPGPGCSATGNMQALYPRLVGGDDSAQSVATMENKLLDSWIPDAVVLYLGGNDWWTLTAENEGELIAGFLAQLRSIRQLRPDSVIIVLLASGTSFCACVPSSAEQERYSADMRRCWEAAATQFEDPNVYLENVDPDPPVRLDLKDDWGNMGHWSAQGHAKWAHAVAPLVASRLS